MSRMISIREKGTKFALIVHHVGEAEGALDAPLPGLRKLVGTLAAVDPTSVHGWTDYGGLSGQKYEVRVVDMTDEEVENLPEWDEW